MPRKSSRESLKLQTMGSRARSEPSSEVVGRTSIGISRWTWTAVLLVTGVWLVMACAISSRIHLVMSYQTIATVPPAYEPVAIHNAALCLLLCLAAVWLVLVYRVARTNPRLVGNSLLWLCLSCVPFLLWMIRVVCGEAFIPTSIFEPLWLALFTGVALHQLLDESSSSDLLCSSKYEHNSRNDLLIVAGASSLAGTWWYWQTRAYYDNFILGFNDFGHFAQRIASTATGRSFLLESPILPPFWDHFNPGLLLLVPIWKLTESIDTIFGIQALCLASGGVLLWRIAIALEVGRRASVMWGLAWLTHPVLGQMNLAYTYGWHPVSLAIPLLLASLLNLLKRRYRWSIVLAVLASSMEENIIVVISLFAFARAIRFFVSCRLGLNRDSLIDSGLNGMTWSGVAFIFGLAFILVYQLSGMADFQSGRFVALGNSPGEIILSPVLRPGEFWGHVFSFRTLVFLLALLSPLYLPALLRGRWVLLSVSLPLGVLVVWDHLPAQSLAFQYPSGMLPLLWLAAIAGSLGNCCGHELRESVASETTQQGLKKQTSIKASAASLATGLTLSLFLGQFPWSGPTLRDVEARTYISAPDQVRSSDSPDGIWLTELVKRIRNEGNPVLATGRIAAHLVGSEEVETIGQFAQRRDKLVEITPHGESPLRRYATIVIDFNETFQQSRAESLQVQKEAIENGFDIEISLFNITLFRRRDAN